jgi:hypothetical protein
MDVPKAWRACVIFLVALRSPCISHEGVKGLRLLVGMLLQNEGCSHWGQSSPLSALNMHVCSEMVVSLRRQLGEPPGHCHHRGVVKYFRAHIQHVLAQSLLAWLRRLNAEPLLLLTREKVIVCLPRASVPRWPSAPGYCWGSPTSAVQLHQLLLQF